MLWWLIPLYVLCFVAGYAVQSYHNRQIERLYREFRERT